MWLIVYFPEFDKAWHGPLLGRVWPHLVPLREAETSFVKFRQVANFDKFHLVVSPWSLRTSSYNMSSSSSSPESDALLRIRHAKTKTDLIAILRGLDESFEVESLEKSQRTLEALRARAFALQVALDASLVTQTPSSTLSSAFSQSTPSSSASQHLLVNTPVIPATPGGAAQSSTSSTSSSASYVPSTPSTNTLPPSTSAPASSSSASQASTVLYSNSGAIGGASFTSPPSSLLSGLSQQAAQAATTPAASSSSASASASASPSASAPPAPSTTAAPSFAGTMPFAQLLRSVSPSDLALLAAVLSPMISSTPSATPASQPSSVAAAYNTWVNSPAASTPSPAPTTAPPASATVSAPFAPAPAAFAAPATLSPSVLPVAASPAPALATGSSSAAAAPALAPPLAPRSFGQPTDNIAQLTTLPLLPGFNAEGRVPSSLDGIARRRFEERLHAAQVVDYRRHRQLKGKPTEPLPADRFEDFIHWFAVFVQDIHLFPPEEQLAAYRFVFLICQAQLRWEWDVITVYILAIEDFARNPNQLRTYSVRPSYLLELDDSLMNACRSAWSSAKAHARSPDSSRLLQDLVGRSSASSSSSKSASGNGGSGGGSCSRCGRSGHRTSGCYARFSLSGAPLDPASASDKKGRKSGGGTGSSSSSSSASKSGSGSD